MVSVNSKMAGQTQIPAQTAATKDVQALLQKNIVKPKKKRKYSASAISNARARA